MQTLEWINSQIAVIAGPEARVIRVFLIVFCTLVVDFIVKRILNRVYKKLQSTKTLWDDAFIYAIKIPGSVLIWVLGLSFALDVIDFAYTKTIRELGIVFSVS